MKRHLSQPDDSLESDAVWQLLDHATPRAARPSFLADTVRLARLEGQPRPAWWWHRLWAPAPLGGLAAAAAAIAIAFMVFHQPDPRGEVVVTPAESFENIQQLAEEEALTAALEYSEDFSDSELVYLIGM